MQESSKAHDINSDLRDPWAAHASVRAELRASDAPIIRNVSPPRILHAVNSTFLASTDEFHANVQRRFGDGFAPIGDVAQMCFQRMMTAPPGSLDEPVDHDTLAKILASGVVPQGLPPTSIPIPLEVALGRVEALGYLVPPRFFHNAVNSYSENAAFAAAHDVLKRRLLSPILYFSSQFIVRDPLKEKKVPYIIDQLWIARAEGAANRVRLIALEIDGEQHLAEHAAERDSQRDVMLQAMGYEVFRVAGWWSRIDPRRVVHAFCEAAGISSNRFQIRVPGNTINDYRCSSCHHPMIRNELGYGMVRHKGLFVHEFCFNRVVDEGEFDWFDYAGDEDV